MTDPSSQQGEPYEVAETPMIPALFGETTATETVEELVERMAQDFVGHSLNCCRAFGDFHLALSGGSTPLAFYRHLMIDPVCRAVPWKRTHVWQVDERRVPMDDEASNWNVIRELIGDHADVPANQLHPMNPMEEDADAAYEKQLREALEWRERGQDRLDYVLLGVGSDGHTASLFPGSALLGETDRLVRMTTAPAGVTPSERMTMTLPLINAARFVGVMVTGAGKRRVVARIAAGKEPVTCLPIAGVRPVGGSMCWYLDHPACPTR